VGRDALIASVVARLPYRMLYWLTSLAGPDSARLLSFCRGGFMATALVRESPSWIHALQRVVYRLGVVTVSGGLLGLVIGGVGGRLAMMLLARLNPEVTGLVSDDGFRIGQFTVAATLNLLIFTTLIGVFGGGLYLVLRPLMIGPRWFQLLSISVGAAIVVGAVLVHPAGVDFTFLRPVWLAVALFVAIPGAYAALLALLADRWLGATENPSWRLRILFTASLLLWIPLAPVLLLGALGWLLSELLRRRVGDDVLRWNASLAWVLRLGLTLLFLVSLANLRSDISELI
jgi:hypothetical protein